MKTLTLITVALLALSGCSMTNASISPETDKLFTQKEWKPINTDKKIQKEIFYEK